MNTARTPAYLPIAAWPIGLLAALALSWAAPVAHAEAMRYRIDPTHFSIGFLIDHAGYEKLLGQFLKGQGSFVYDELNQTLASGRVEIDAASVFTNHQARDEHVRSDDFLNVADYPRIVFEATGFTAEDARHGTLTGDLSMLGRTHPITLDVTLNKAAPYPFGHERHTLGLSARTSLERSRWGMSYGVADALVGDRVEVILELEAIRQ